MIAILQTIYLLVNIIGVTVGLVWFVTAADCFGISQLLTFTKKHFGKIGVVIVGCFVTILFAPAIALVSIIITFITLIGAYI